MLTIDNLSYSYPNSTVDTVKNISCSIEKGEVFGFLGPSGSGKSTTQKILYKLLKGYSGEISFNNKKLENWAVDFYDQIGVSFELPNHYAKLTALENLQFFSAFYTNPTVDLMGLMDRVGLADDANKLVSDFSKGMKMRLNFIRALVHNPTMLFLDEPTSGLDPINANKIKTIIKELQQEGKTIFITTHNMFDADQLCNRVALLHEGEIVALDTPEHLKLKYGSNRVKITTKEPHAKTLDFEMEGLGQNKEFLTALNQYSIETIHSQEATLEQVFIELTGERLSI